MPYDTLPPGTVPNSRWDFMRTRLPDEQLPFFWAGFAVAASASAFANAIVTSVILLRPNLRAKQFNQLLVGLSFPDFVFSASCALSCFLNTWHGQQFGGTTHCDVQGMYVTFGFAASIWMNVAIAIEMNRLAQCAVQIRTFDPLSNRALCLRVLAVYVWAILCSVIVAWDGFPVHANSAFGLACIPLQSNLMSEIVFWCAFIPAIFIIPLFLTMILSYRIYKMFPGRSMQYQLTLESLQLSEVFHVYARLLFVLVGLWLPSALLLWAFPISGPVAFAGGMISHIQGLVSAYLYSLKQDIHDEILKLCPHCAKRPRRAASVRSVSSGSFSRQVNQGVHQILARQVLGETVSRKGELATTADCVFEIVKPSTVELQCCYAQLMLEATHDDGTALVGASTAFVSHSWLMAYTTLVNIICQYESELDPLTNATRYYWLDLFAINQHRVTDHGELDQLGCIVVACGVLLLASSPWSAPLPLSRAWCLYELYMAATNNVHIELGLSSKDVDAFYQAMDASSMEIRDAVANVDLRKASATVEADRDMIFAQIDEGVGMDAFNRRISQAMLASFTQLAMRRNLSKHLRGVTISIKEKLKA